MKTNENNSTFLMVVIGLLIILFFSGASKEIKFEKPIENEIVSVEPLLGEITMFAGNFAPRGWALCDGQLLPIAQYSALFSILGTTYGGDGRTTFALPDLRGRVPIHAGSGPGLTNHRLGSKGGSEMLSTSTLKIKDVGKSGETQVVGGARSMSNMQPYATINYIIALQGVFPSRN